MEAAAHTDPEAWRQLDSLMQGKMSHNSQMPQKRKPRTAKNGQNMVKRKQVQVSQQVKQVTNPSRRKEDQRYLPKKIHHHPVNPTPGTSKDPTPGTSKDPTNALPGVPTQDPTQDPTEAKAEEVEVETPPELTAYVKSYKLAGKNRLDMVLDQKEQAYDTLYDRLVKIGAPHKKYLDQAVKEQVVC